MQVEILRNQACGTCRKRKKKCDRQVPSCTQCKKAGWDCEYKSRYAFLHSEAKRAESSAAASRNSDAGSSSEAQSNSETPSPVEESRITTTVKHYYNLPALPSFTATDRLLTDFCLNLDRKSFNARLEVFPTYPLLRNVPERLGHSSALDDAARCVCASRPNPYQFWDASQAQASRQRYIKALKSLQTALNDRNVATSSETLTAITLLQMYECNVNHEGSGWAQHSLGAVRLIQLRGPEAIKDDIDWAILEAELGSILFSHIRREQPCFLADRKWKDLITSPSRKPKTRIPGYNDLISVLVDFPGILKDYLALVRESFTLCSRPEDSEENTVEEILKGTDRFPAYTNLLERCQKFTSGLSDWRRNHSKIQTTLRTLQEDAEAGPTKKYLSVVDYGFNILSSLFLIFIAHIQTQLGHDIADVQSLFSIPDEEWYPRTLEAQQFLSDEIKLQMDWTFAIGIMHQDFVKLETSNPDAYRISHFILRQVWWQVTRFHSDSSHYCEDPILCVLGDGSFK